MAGKKRRRPGVLDKHANCVRREGPEGLPDLLREAEADLAKARDRAQRADFVADAMGGLDAGAVREQRAAAVAVEGARRYVANLKQAIDKARASGELPTPRAPTPEQEAKARDLARRILRR